MVSNLSMFFKTFGPSLQEALSNMTNIQSQKLSLIEHQSTLVVFCKNFLCRLIFQVDRPNTAHIPLVYFLQHISFISSISISTDQPKTSTQDLLHLFSCISCYFWSPAIWGTIPPPPPTCPPPQNFSGMCEQPSSLSLWSWWWKGMSSGWWFTWEGRGRGGHALDWLHEEVHHVGEHIISSVQILLAAVNCL